MKALGQAASDQERMAETAIATIESWQDKDIRYEPAAVAVVSPIHRAVESACFNLSLDGEALFLKVRHADMARFFDDAAVATNCERAAEAGVTPKLRYNDPGRGIFVFDRLAADWDWGKIDALTEPAVLEAIVMAKKRLHGGSPFARSETVFDVIERYWSMVTAEQAWVPADVPALLERVRSFGEAIAAAGIDPRPCHGDGVASNVMLGDGAAVQLVDFDLSANMDPYYDLGSLMVELCQFDEDARQILEIYDGSFVESHYNRCRLYGIADDLMWALWGFICFKLSPRKEVEFTKYAEWRLLRCRWQLGHPQCDHWVARV